MLFDSLDIKICGLQILLVKYAKMAMYIILVVAIFQNALKMSATHDKSQPQAYEEVDQSDIL
jgi:hypothetical protein